MATVVASVNRSERQDNAIKAQALERVAKTLGGACGAMAVLALAFALLRPSAGAVVVMLTTGGLAVVCFATLALLWSARDDPAAFMLVWGMLIVLTLAHFAVAAPTSRWALNTGPLVVAGLLLRTRQVQLFAAVAGLLFLLHLATVGSVPAFVVLSEFDNSVIDISTVAGLYLVLSVTAATYSSRLGLVLSGLDTNAKEADRRARDLAEAQVEIGRQMAQLGQANQAIEAKRRVSLGVAAEVRDTAAELEAASSEQASASTEQAAAMAEIAATIEELTQTSAQIADNSLQVSRLVTVAFQAAETGRGAVEETIAGLDRIRAEVQRAASKNLALGQRTQAVGDILEVIKEIADRTHLLALNASIESAAAGEWGRRFSVVASQVKELANEARSAAHEVGSAMQEIQRAADETVLAAERSESYVEDGAELGSRAGRAISQVLDSVLEVEVASKEMLVATQQQQSAHQQVVKTVQEMEQVARQSALAILEISQSVRRLKEASTLLQ